jgi:hypothetical protein
MENRRTRFAGGIKTIEYAIFDRDAGKTKLCFPGIELLLTFSA